MKRNLTYRIKEDHFSDLLSIQVETNLGKIEIATEYIPPRIGYLHYPDYYHLFKSKDPVYFIGDINARHSTLGNSNNNLIGTQVNTLIQRNNAIHKGPFFPTYITQRSKTTPDIILTNTRVFHNTLAENGPLTPSDHIPIIFKISLNPIMIKIPKRFSFKKADWSTYNEQLKKVPIVQLQYKTKEDIDTAVEKLTTNIQNASKVAIPEIQFRTIPHFHTNLEIQQLQQEHDILLATINNLGPNHNRYQRLRQLREQLKEQYRRISNEMWD